LDRIFDIGGIRIALRTPEPGFASWLEGIDGYRNFLSASPGPTDAVVNLRFRGERGRGRWQNRSAATLLRHRGNECHILHHDFLAHCSPDFTELDVILPAEDIYGFDNLLRFLLSIHAVHHGGFLLHAATLEHQEEAYVLYGLSGAGKSTAAAQSVPGRRCLAEDATLVVTGNSRATAWATPLLHHSGPEPPRPGGFPVRGFFRLAQTPALDLSRITGAHAARSLMRRVLLYEGFHLSANIFSICVDVAASTRHHYELGLTLGSDFWPPMLEALVE